MADTKFRATMMLCDHAQVAEGKLFISGGGWSETFTPTRPSAVALLLHVPWGEANRRIKFALRLIDADGNPVVQPGTAGDVVPVVAEGELEVGRPPGLPEGTTLEAPFAINLPPMLLAPRQQFVWELSINNETRDDWSLTFRTSEAARGKPTPL